MLYTRGLRGKLAQLAHARHPDCDNVTRQIIAARVQTPEGARAFIEECQEHASALHTMANEVLGLLNEIEAQERQTGGLPGRTPSTEGFV